MALPVTHIIVPMLILETYRRYFAKKKFSKWYVFLGGVFGAAPDFDFFVAKLFTGVFDSSYHRAYSHSLFITIFFFIISGLLYLIYSKKLISKIDYNRIHQISIVSFLIGFGVMCHIFLDAIDGFQLWFYPLNILFPAYYLMEGNLLPSIYNGALMLIWLLYQEDLFNDILKFFKIKK